MATLKISDLSVGDWVAIDGADLKIEHGDIATAFVKEVRKPICIQSIIGEGELVFARAYHLDGYGTLYAKEEHLRPIPITPEILEANGLCRHEIDEDNPQQVVLSNHFMLARTYTDVDWWRVLIYDEEIPSKVLFNGIVYYVHQLQHALRLAGVDKEIVMPNK